MNSETKHDFDAALASGTQQLNRLNERFEDGLWDWEISVGKEWYSTRLVALLDYTKACANEGSYPNELMRLLAQSTQETVLATRRIRERLANSADFDERLNIIDAEGESIWLRVRGGVSNDTLEGPYSAGAIEDISDRVLLETERQKFSQELERSNAELQAFASVASHDLKAPLRHVSELARRIQQSEEDSNSAPLSEEQKLCLSEMKDRIGLMDELLNGMLEYARVGRPEDRSETVDFEELASDSLGLLAPPREFRIDLDVTALPLKADTSVLEKCFRNLLDNAIKHANKEDPHVRISIADIDSHVCIAVHDNGPGIPEEQRVEVFDLFATLDQTEATRGAGMGLAIVKKSIENAGGNASIRTSELGGACVELCWPRQAV